MADEQLMAMNDAREEGRRAGLEEATCMRASVHELPEGSWYVPIDVLRKAVAQSRRDGLEEAVQVCELEDNE